MRITFYGTLYEFVYNLNNNTIILITHTIYRQKRIKKWGMLDLSYLHSNLILTYYIFNYYILLHYILLHI